MSGRSKQAATVAVGETVSTSINLGPGSLGVVSLPSGVTAATFALHGSFDDVTFKPLYDVEGAALTITATDNSMIPVDPVWTYAVPIVRLVGNTAQLTTDAVIVWGAAPV